MTIPPDSLSRHPLHSSSSPVMLSLPPPPPPLLPPDHLSRCKSNLPVSKLLQTPHISFVEGHTQEVSSTCSVLHLNTAFLTSRSRVLKFFNLPPFPSVFLHDLFLNTAHESKSLVPIPKSLWIRRAECSAISPRDGVWAVFGTHEEARSAFTLFGSSTSISPALESDLEPLHSLQRLQQHRTITGLPMSITIQSPVPASASDLPCNGRGRLAPLRPSHAMFCRPDHTNTTTSFPVPGFTLSSNPPNPRTLFRMGDWMCPSANCAAHNFGRNFSCIGCGCPRPSKAHAPSPRSSQPHGANNTTQVPSPRFAGIPESQMPASLSHRIPHILTPSGRAFSVGGRVQDVSSDPLLPCILFWPDNEPFPEQGQIRRSGPVGVPHPPILNTGNRGPIEHQPGDWICEKCNYLNWRRRKVCQTCYPYAEGNGDSIPAAVQADRIKRLREALSVTLPPSVSTFQTTSPDHLPQSPFAHIHHPHGCYLDSCGCRSLCTSTLQSRDQTQPRVELDLRHKDTIYQTSTPPVSLSYSEHALLAIGHTSGPLLPSCLQDIVQSPSLSPASTASADLSVDECVSSPVSVYSTSSSKHYANNDRSLRVHRTPSSVSLGLGNIWRLDGEESKALSSSLSSQNEISRV